MTDWVSKWEDAYKKKYLVFPLRKTTLIQKDPRKEPIIKDPYRTYW